MVFKNHIYGSESDIPSPVNPYLDKIISLWRYEDNADDFKEINDGVATGITYSDGLIGKCADFNSGSSSKIVVSSSPSLSFGNGTDNSEWSFSTLVYFDTVANACFINKRTSSNTAAEYQFLRNSENIQFNIFNVAVDVGIATQAYTFSAATWYHVGFSYDGETNVKIVVNGEVYAKTITKRIMTAGIGDVVLGKHNFNTTFTLQGKMDETKLWNVVLSDAEWLDIATKELSGINILE